MAEFYITADALALGPLAHISDFAQAAFERMNAEIEARIECFRECGVEVHRMSIVTERYNGRTSLCVDNIARFSWVICYGH